MQQQTFADKFQFQGKCVWVTGAGQGIGFQVALQFTELGAHVIGLDRAFASAVHYPFETITLDISQPEAVQRCAADLLARHGSIHVLVNVAGILRLGATDEISLEDWQASLDVNLSGPFYLMRQLIPTFKAQGFGSIVTVSSNAAHVPRLNMSAYCASKAALSSLCHCVALELAPYGVRCNLVSPGSTDTQMQRQLWHSPQAQQQTIDGFPGQYKLGIPLGKIAKVEDIANTVTFLASDLAGHITMQDVVVDGGATLTA